VSRKVTAPDRTVWVVRRGWIKWRPWWKVRGRGVLGHFEVFLALDELLPPVVILVLVLFFVLIPGLLLLVQHLLFFVVLALLLTARVLFRRPWLVEATRDSQTRAWRVVG
jgi:hypothetical protein